MANTDKKESFVFYRSFYEALQNVPKKHRTEVYEAVFAYAFESREPSLTGVTRALWELIRPQLDASEKRYENAKKGAEYGYKGAEYGRLGGRPRKQQEDEKKPPLRGNNKNPLNVNDNHNDNSNHNHNDNQNGNANVTLSPPNPLKGAESERNLTPTLSEVRAYAQERFSSVDPEEFYDFYSSKGWLVGKSPMKDWKAAFRGWERNHQKAAANNYTDVDDWLRRREAEDDQTGIFDNQ